MKRYLSLLVFSWIALLLGGCGTQTPPDSDGALLLGFDSLPKALVTIQFTETPDPGIVQATSLALTPTMQPLPPTFTPTPTPYVGVFMGNITPESGTVVYRPGTYHGALIVSGGAAVGVPVPAATIAPSVPAAATLGGVAVPAGNCAEAPAPPFVNVANNANIRAKLGCPSGGPFGVRLVIQPFQNGFMFWRDTKEIFVLSTLTIGQQGIDIYWRVADSWNETLPADDLSLVPPQGLLQPVRGFGYVWRGSQAIRDRVGWAFSPEQPYDPTWQLYERGWMMTGIDGKVFALAPNPDASTGSHFGALNQ